MIDTYTAHFISYAHDIRCRLRDSQDETIDQLTELIPMSEENKIDLTDRLNTLRDRCFSESFCLGVELGLRLAGEFMGK